MSINNNYNSNNINLLDYDQFKNKHYDVFDINHNLLKNFIDEKIPILVNELLPLIYKEIIDKKYKEYYLDNISLVYYKDAKCCLLNNLLNRNNNYYLVIPTLGTYFNRTNNKFVKIPKKYICKELTPNILELLRISFLDYSLKKIQYYSQILYPNLKFEIVSNNIKIFL